MASSDNKTTKAPPPNDVETNARDFSISLYQAFCRTGPFLPESPHAHEALVTLYRSFIELFTQSGAMNYYLREKNEVVEIFLEGSPVGVLPLSKVITKGMAVVYVSRLIELFHQKSLVSLSINAGIDKDAFLKIIELIGDKKFTRIGIESSKNDFLKAMAARGVKGVSFLFEEDLIPPGRKIPWRVNLALSRLRKELDLLSTLRNLSGAELQQAAAQTLQSTLDQLSTPELVYAFIMNLDLAENSALRLEERESTSIKLLDQGVLNAVVPLFIEDAVHGREEVTSDLGPDKLPRMRDLLTKQLIEIDSSGARDCLQDLYSSGLISIEGFPPILRERLAIMRLVESFMEYSDKYLQHLDSAQTADEYATRARPLALIVPHLIKGRKYREAHAICELLFSHTESKGKKDMAGQALSEIAQGTALAEATKAFMAVPKENRIVLGRIFTLLGTWSVSCLIKIIRETDDLWRRKQACEILVGMGTEPAEYLVSMVEGASLPPETVSTVIKVLATTEDENLAALVASAVEKHLGSEDVQVRHDALNALSLTAPRQNYERFEAMLKDPDPDIVKESLRGLGLSGDNRALLHLTDVILAAETAGDEVSWGLATAAVFSLGNLFDTNHQTRPEIEAFICEFTQRGVESGLLKRVIGKSENFPPKVLAALAPLLGRFKGGDSMKLLARMAKSGEESVAKRASDELKKLAKL